MSALDRSALHQLYNDHNSWLKGWLRVRLGNTADACDLAQDTFLRVMTARHDAPIREPRGYLSAIARSLLIDKVRRRTIEQAYLQALALKPEPVDIPPKSACRLSKPWFPSTACSMSWGLARGIFSWPCSLKA